MVISLTDKLFMSTPDVRGCPCGATAGQGVGLLPLSIMLQLSTVGVKPRRRAKSVTIHLCKKCARLAQAKRGRALRDALAAAVYLQFRGLTVERGAQGG